MKLSRSEFLVLREILRSEEKGASYNTLLKTLKDRLSNQGLSDALKALQVKNLIFRDFVSKVKGSHAVYRSTGSSFDALYANDMAEFLFSDENTTTRFKLPSSSFETGSLCPQVILVSGAGEKSVSLKEDQDFCKKIWGAAQHVVSTWLEHRQKNHNEHFLAVAKEYEEALAEYLLLFRCQMKRWTPEAVNELKAGSYDYVDPLDMMESQGGIDWPLKKYHIDEDGLESRRKDLLNADDELSRISAEGLGKLREVIYDKEKKRVYEGYLKSLIPPKMVLLMDFGISTESARKWLTSEMESREYESGESESFAGIVSKSAFGEAKRAYGKKEPEPSPYGPENSVRSEKNPKWFF